MKTFEKSHQLFEKAKEVIPLATQTFSKSYLQYIRDVAPLFITHGKGSRVWDVDGNEYVDFVNGLLAIILGYQYPAVDDAIRNQLESGINFSLPSPLEYELAKKLTDLIPCAEMVRFGKNGSDVTSGAIRLARAVTGREHVVVCGYHGWHDWYIGSTAKHLGVPESTRAQTHKFEYNNLDSLGKVFAQYKDQIAAVIMEPMNYKEPEEGFLAGVRDMAHAHGALLIFDEVITGFRFHLNGAQTLFGVTPDLATFGKSMANGMPIAALVGKKEYMERVGDIFYSFTHGGEALSIAAALAVIKEMEDKHVIDTIWEKGKYLSEKTTQLIESHGLADIMHIAGKPCWSMFMMHSGDEDRDLEIKSYMQQEILQAGYLWYGQHNMSFSHTQEDIDGLLHVYDVVFGQLKGLLDNGTLSGALRGKPITNIFKVR